MEKEKEEKEKVNDSILKLKERNKHLTSKHVNQKDLNVVTVSCVLHTSGDYDQPVVVQIRKSSQAFVWMRGRIGTP